MDKTPFPTAVYPRPASRHVTPATWIQVFVVHDLGSELAGRIINISNDSENVAFPTCFRHAPLVLMF
ncbi:hypothetical protein C6366_02635 [Desulfonatronum sp. SC1]|nr:hypothetical protein C6366_02635 [Desulfonatronum sp. SC1]